MSRNDPQLKARADVDAPAAEGSFTSLSKTLEDLEARLTRLSMGKRPTEDAKEAVAIEDHSAQDAAARLRAISAQRRAARPALGAGTSSIALERQMDSDPASGQPAPRPRPAPRAPAPSVEKRLGHVAGEVEQLQAQGATLAAVKSLAKDLSTLRSEIHESVADAQLSLRFEDMRKSLGEIKRLVGESKGADKIGAEIFSIMEQLTELTASNADQASLMELRAELDTVSSLVAQMAREESVQAVQRRWDEFEARIAARIELDSQAQRDLRVELERLRGSLRSLSTEEQILAVQQRWEEFEARYVDTVRSQTEETLTRILKGELDTLRSKLDALASEASGAAIEARFEAMTAKLPIRDLEAGISRLSERMGEVERALVGLPEILQLDQMEGRIQALASSIETLAAEIREPDLSHFALLEERLDEISAAILNGGLSASGEMAAAPLQRIEARVMDLAARVDQIAEAGDAELLSAQIAAMSAQIEELSARPAADELGSRIDRLSERVERLFKTTGGEIASHALEARLQALAERLEQSASAVGVDNDVIRSLEMQIGRLAEILAGAPALLESDSSEVAQRLEALEQKFDQDRDSVVAAARAAAEEAVRRMQAGENDRQNAYVRDLADDLRRLEELCRRSDERAVGVFDAVHATLVKIVDRLTTIEGDLRLERGQAASKPAMTPSPVAFVDTPVAADPTFETVAEIDPIEDETEQQESRGLRGALARRLRRAEKPVEAKPSLADRIRPQPEAVLVPPRAEPSLEVEAPSLDAADSFVEREADRPLEPGSGVPDIAALIERVRTQQRAGAEASDPVAKADFIAAARKAAMAAAAEAEALKSDASMADPEVDGASRRRKPILMAVGAVLLALMAIPLGQRYLASHNDAVNNTLSAPALERPATGSASEIMPAPTMATPAPEAPAETPAEQASPERTGEIVTPVSEPQVAAMATETSAPSAETAPAPVVEASMPAAEDTSVAKVEDAAVTVAQADTSPIETASVAPAAPAADVAPAADATNAGSASPLLAAAQSKLPADAQGALPTLPEKIGPAALKTAAVEGEPMALFEVGLRVMEGRAAPSDPKAAMAWFGQAASRGYAPAQYSVGTLFEKGNGVARDTGAARDWYRLAADQGNIRAMHNLAVLYATGIEGASDPKAAAGWFLRAAQHGMRDSQYNLGILYARGVGVEPNLGESYRWFRIVGAAGDKDAQNKMEEVGKSLAPELRAQIDAETAAWKPEPRIDAANTVDIPASWNEKSGQTASVDMSKAIRNVQAILLKLGYNPGRPDGVVGEQTTAAIRKFQEKTGLQTTGQIDEPLIRALLERKDS
ncbi:peptidoglycan-binding protein [Aureimonas sp. D3]|uniref:peptidoglycan-binding protein n=1 Tax=Aureimonas sp. D3 TaxID=1638164 RepID=UPI000780EFF4|nr:peptidoglycan-binding protein [Aureimonas sp. D3]